MDDYIFLDKSTKPTDPELKKALGAAFDHFVALRDLLSDYTFEWKFYTKKTGWQLKVAGTKRAACYIIPFNGYFSVGMAVRESEKEAVLNSKVRKSIRDELAAAKKYPEGWPLPLTVKTAADLKVTVTVLKLAGRL